LKATGVIVRPVDRRMRAIEIAGVAPFCCSVVALALLMVEHIQLHGTRSRQCSLMS
jgi:hypothetical protein